MENAVANPGAPPAPARAQPVRAPPQPPSFTISRFDSAEQDPVQLALKYRVFRKDVENAATQYCQTLAYHFRSQVEALNVGARPEDRFADENERATYAQYMFTEVTNIAKQMFAVNDTGAPVVIPPIDVTGQTALNATFAGQAQADSVRLLESLTESFYLTLIDPSTTKFRLQTYTTRTHATLHGAPTAAGTCCLWDCDENFDAHDPFAGIRLQLEAMLFDGTGDSISDLRVREDLRIRINAFYRRVDGTIDRERKDNEASVAEIIRSESNPDLFAHLKQLLTSGDIKCRDPNTLTKYIRQWKHGDKTLPAKKTHDVMALQDMTRSAAEMVMAAMHGYNSDDDQINAMVTGRPMQCAACGELGDHITVMCPNAKCVYKNCLRGPGKGHTELCPRYKGWQKALALEQGKTTEIRKPGNMPQRKGFSPRFQRNSNQR